MKRKLYFIVPLLLMSLEGCSCSNKGALTIWVGNESVSFYSDVIKDYEKIYNEKNDDRFPKWKVKGIDVGNSAETFLQDNEAGADIFLCTHDNLGILTAGSSVIAPITNEELLKQIDNDNTKGFKDIIVNEVQGQKYTFGVPLIAQSLVYYYNTSILSKDDVKTWEQIMKACAKKSKTLKATSILGEDGYNNSFLLLARKVNPDNTTTTSVKLYEDGILENCFLTGDDSVAIMKWGQDFFSNPNGCYWPSSSGFEVELKDGHSAGLIGGSWNYKAVKTALGSSFGVTTLPRFTINESQAYGSINEGTIFQSGTFADCKILVMKKNSKYQQYLQDIMMYMSNKTIQERSFEECSNLPAYINAVSEFESLQKNDDNAKTAAAQIKMFEYGIAQPFGIDTKYNTYYYSKGGPEYIKAILNDKNLKESNRKFVSDKQIKDELNAICNIWKTGQR